MLVDEGLELLGEADCWRLLRSAEVGRVAITMSALPAIFPVNFTMIDNTIVFRTSAGSKLDAAYRQTVVAFEVDSYDPVERSGWSVLVVGRSEVVHDIELTSQVVDSGLEPWAGGRRTHLVRITPGFVSGRRIVEPNGSSPRPGGDGRAMRPPPGGDPR